MAAKGFDFATTYAHVEDGPRVTLLEVGEDFWATIDKRADLTAGRLVCLCSFDEDWPSWEMHPAGDEVVYQLSGSADLILDEPGGQRVVELRGRAAVIVPQGVWHRAVVHERSETLHITRGAGTRHRPVE